VGVACDGADTDLCNEGFTECTGGAIVCNDTTGDNPDICDGLDNDCNPSTLDGSQDPMSGVLCDGADSDLCEEGQWVCTGGFLSCNDFTGDTVELCNTLDDDCDGIADDDPDATMCTREHGSPPGVTAWTCSGTCSISGCTSSTADLDGIISNGCECTGVDTLANSCAAASPRSVGLGASINVSGKITTAGGSDWIRFDFTNRPAPQTYQPKVQLTGGVGDFLMDVETSCGVNAGCSDGPAVGIEFWDRLWFYFSGPGCCSDAVGHITSVRVRVYRPDGVASCDSYTVTATNL
jgi:hypothetical protein